MQNHIYADDTQLYADLTGTQVGEALEAINTYNTPHVLTCAYVKLPHHRRSATSGLPPTVA